MYLPDKQACGKGTVNGCSERSGTYCSIKEPAEKVQLAAVQKNPEYIRHIESPTVKVQHMAIQGNADTLRHIKSPADTVQLAAVQAKGETIRYVSEPSEAVQLAAVRNNPMNIRYIENLRKRFSCLSCMPIGRRLRLSIFLRMK